MRTATLIAVAMLAAAGPAEAADRPLRLEVDCLTATAPAGWTSVRSLLGASAVIQSAERFETNGLTFRQKFSILKMSARGLSLEAQRERLFAIMVAEQTRMREALRRARPSMRLRALERPEVVPVEVDGVPALDWTIETIVEIEGRPLPFQTRTRLIVFRDMVYAIVAGVDVGHAGELAPVVDAFLSSVHLDGCSASTTSGAPDDRR